MNARILKTEKKSMISLCALEDTDLELAVSNFKIELKIAFTPTFTGPTFSAQVRLMKEEAILKNGFQKNCQTKSLHMLV